MNRPVMSIEKQNRDANHPRVPRESKGRIRLGRALLRTLLVVCLALGHALMPKVAMGQDSAGEYELKAAMLYNLTRFVEWPPSAYADAQAPTVICILGRDPFGDSLAALAFNATAGGRPVQIRRLSNDRGIHGCHVVYISSSERKSIAQIFATVKGTSVLTVGEMAQFASRGGMIQFSLEEKQVHFDINLEAASEADLKISSRLLVLARIVKEQNRYPGKEGSALWSPPEFEVARTWTQEDDSGLDWNLQRVAIPRNAVDKL